MSASLDMSLDDIITRRKSATAGRGDTTLRGRSRGRGRGRGRGSFSGTCPGPERRLPRYDPNRSTMPYPMQPARQLVEPMMVAGNGGSGREAGTKLYLSNLDYDVTNEDIEILFSEIGELLRYTIHYDRSGRSKGTAEVIFKRQSDALAAIRRYDNVRLDGKPMKIEIVGSNLVYPAPPPPVAPLPPVAASIPQNPHVGVRSRQELVGARGHGSGVRSGGGKDQGWGSARGKDQGRHWDRKLTAGELDSELEKYQLEAMTLKRNRQ